MRLDHAEARSDHSTAARVAVHRPGDPDGARPRPIHTLMNALPAFICSIILCAIALVIVVAALGSLVVA